MEAIFLASNSSLFLFSASILGITLISRLKRLPLPLSESIETIDDSTNDGKYRIYKFCITGGPCGGKTTGKTSFVYFYLINEYSYTYISPST